MITGNDNKKVFAVYLQHICFALLLVVTIISMNTNKVYAASADISFETGGSDVTVGDIITVEMIISADVYPGDFEGYIQYTSDTLSYASGPEVIAGGEGILRINDVVAESDRNTRKYVLKFRATGIGAASVTMRNEPSLYEFESGYLMSVSYNTLSFTVLASNQASSDASLKSIKVNPGKLEPTFESNTKEYYTSVPNDVKSLVVSAVCNDENAIVTVEGNTELQEGQNRIVIRVKAEDGNENKYVIYCVREKAGSNSEDGSSDITITPVPDTDDNTSETEEREHFSFYATETDGEIFITSDVRYKLVGEDENVVIPKGFTKTSIIISDIKIPVYAPADNLSGEFLLVILSRDGGKPGLYRYDRSEKTIQRYVTTDVVYKNDDSAKEDKVTPELEAKYNKSVSTLTTIIAILCGICVVLLIVIIRFAILSKSDKDELD